MRRCPGGAVQWRRSARAGLDPPLTPFRRLTSAIPARSEYSGWNDWGQLGLGDTQRRRDNANEMDHSMVANRQNYGNIFSAVKPSTLDPKP